MIRWLASTAEIADVEAYALYSMAGSFRITQYADQVASALHVALLLDQERRLHMIVDLRGPA